MTDNLEEFETFVKLLRQLGVYSYKCTQFELHLYPPEVLPPAPHPDTDSTRPPSSPDAVSLYDNPDLYPDGQVPEVRRRTRRDTE